MLFDIIVMALPLRQLWNLNLSLRKKAYVMCMFSLGILYVITISPANMYNANIQPQCYPGQHSSSQFPYPFCFYE